MFVFPRNVVGFRDLLAEAGIEVYRGRPGAAMTPRRWRSLRRLLVFLFFLAPVPARTVEAVVDDRGMVNVPASMALYTRRGVRRLVASRALAAKATGGLDRAASQGRIFHLWLHPSNLVHAMEAQFATLESILGHARTLCDAGRLEIVTMGDIGTATRAAPRPRPPFTEPRWPRATVIRAVRPSRPVTVPWERRLPSCP
jgi:hypothetical protein